MKLGIKIDKESERIGSLSNFSDNEKVLIPAGEYVCEITDAEEKTKSNGDRSLCIGFKIQEAGEYNGEMIWDNVPITGSKRAVNFGERKLRLIMECINMDVLEFSEELKGETLIVKTIVKEWNGKDYCNVLDYLSMGEEAVGSLDIKNPDTPSLEDDELPF